MGWGGEEAGSASVTPANKGVGGVASGSRSVLDTQQTNHELDYVSAKLLPGRWLRNRGCKMSDLQAPAPVGFSGSP